MNRVPLLRSLKRYGSVITIAMLLALVLVPAVQAVHDNGVFELEGDAFDSTGAGLPDDWDRLDDGFGDPNGDDSALASVFITDPLGGRADPDEIFTGGGSKDDLDMAAGGVAGANVGPWQHSVGAVPDKDNIEHAFAAAYACPDYVNPDPESSENEDAGTDPDLCLYFGLDRFARNGDAQVGFWFLKEDLNADPDGTFSEAHSVGDILILSDFTNGGAVSVIRVFQWVGTGGDTNGTLDNVANQVACGASTADIACASANTLEVPSPWFYDPKAGPDNTFPLGSFFEGGVNLNSLGLDIGCGGSFLAETRSSQSVDATLKDFALGDFSLCTANIQIGEDGTNPVGTPHTVTGHVNVVQNGVSSNAPAGTVITFTIVSGPGALTPATPTTCATIGTTGSCSVTLNSTEVGTTVVHAASDVTSGGSTIHVETNGTAPNSDDLQKIWIQKFQIIVITCDDTQNVLADGTVNLGAGADTPTITDTQFAALGWKDSDGTALTEADFCSQAGANFGNLDGGSYSLSVEVPTVP